MPCVVQGSHAIEWYFGKAANHLNAVNIRGSSFKRAFYSFEVKCFIIKCLIVNASRREG